MVKISSPPTEIKYEDKSIGQPELVPIFKAIKLLLSAYNGKGTLKATGEGKGGQYNIISFKNIEVAGRKMDAIYFASCLVQKGYVGFYYFPIYVAPEVTASVIQPELKKMLKGKTCFHIKKNDPLIISQIDNALKDGFEMYSRMGWV